MDRFLRISCRYIIILFNGKNLTEECNNLILVCFRRENGKSINVKEIADRWDICITSMQKMTKIFMRMRENLGKTFILQFNTN